MAESIEKQRAMRKSPFLEWCDADGLKVISGFGVEDLATAELAHWERLGGPAAYCHLEGSQGFVGALAVEIPPGKSLKPIRHMYEEQVLILQRSFGTTTPSRRSPSNGKPAASFRRRSMPSTNTSTDLPSRSDSLPLVTLR